MSNIRAMLYEVEVLNIPTNCRANYKGPKYPLIVPVTSYIRLPIGPKSAIWFTPKIDESCQALGKAEHY
jgi:hypothetical protein